jgi:SAM-dependent MidA family methyltransferase
MKKLFEKIRQEAAEQGVLSFARFMELALYCPGLGYYETDKGNVGRNGDFYTSVSTGELFGQLLAFQFAEWLTETAARDPELSSLHLVEAGAHDGKLARDILTWLQANRPGLFEQIEYRILEPSARRQEWQRETLGKFSNVRWPDSQLSTLTAQLNGVIFSNELLDAMPVHRYGWDATKQSWFEWGVTVEDEKFIWSKITHHASRIKGCIPNLPSALLEVLPDNYTIETSPAAENWWRSAANALDHGRLLTIDYGLAAEELFSPSRARGTLRAYSRHRASDDLLADPGAQDLTAHVNFPAIQAIGEAAGLTTESFTTQPQFLTQILGKAMKENSLCEWGSKEARQFQTLTHPEHLGRSFRVLIQQK